MIPFDEVEETLDVWKKKKQKKKSKRMKEKMNRNVKSKRLII